jgi:LPS export ABC transporter protein LptC
MAAQSILLKFLLAAGILWIAACENDPAEIKAYTKESKEIEEARDIKANFSQGGIMKAILEAPLMYRVKADTVYTEFPDSVHVTFYNESGAIENVVSANYARYYDLLHKVYMRDSVVVYNTKGDTLFAEDLWWDQNLEIFYSDNPVKVYRGMDRIIGDGIWAKSNLSKLTIKNARGPVAIPAEINPGPPQ